MGLLRSSLSKITNARNDTMETKGTKVPDECRPEPKEPSRWEAQDEAIRKVREQVTRLPANVGVPLFHVLTSLPMGHATVLAALIEGEHDPSNP